MGILFAVASVVLLSLFAVPANAQTGSGTTQSGAVIETGSGETLAEKIEYLHTKLSDRPVTKLSELALSAAKREAMERDTANSLERLTEFRAECRDALRKANRDTLLSKALQCVRADLLQQLSMQRKERVLLDPPLFYTEVIRTDAINALETLMEAEQLIIDGIDAEVFGSVEDLEESKLKLLETYRRTYWWSKTRLRADRSLTFISYIAKQLSSVSASQDSDPSALEEATGAVSCLDNARKDLAQSLASPDEATTRMWLHEALNRMTVCRESLRKAIRLQRNFEKDKAAENSGQEE